MAARSWPGIIMNPPYIKHHELADKEARIAAIERDAGLTFSRLTNLYAVFLVRAGLALAPGGRAAAIVPSELLNANYGRAVKRFLVERGLLRAIISFDFHSNVFAGATTTACIILLEAGPAPAAVGFLNAQELAELS